MVLAALLSPVSGGITCSLCGDGGLNGGQQGLPLLCGFVWRRGCVPPSFWGEPSDGIRGPTATRA